MKCLKKLIITSGFVLIAGLMLPCQATKVFYDKPMKEKSDTYCAVWATEREYKGYVPDDRREPAHRPGISVARPRPFSRIKMYINVAIVSKDGSFSKLFSFPAALRVFDAKAEDLTYVAFAPRASGEHYREFITIEENKLIKYEVGTELSTSNGKYFLKLSTNFAKRRHIASNIDASFEPWEDESGNIYYKAFDGDKSFFYKWDGQKEQATKQKKELKADFQTSYEGEVTEEKDQATLKLGDETFTVPLDFELIDPLEPGEQFLLAPFENYGTDTSPFTLKDFKKLEESFDLEIGKVIALSKLIETDSKISTDLSADQITTAKQHIQQIAKAYKAKKNVLRELKLLMREEGGVLQNLKKQYLSRTHVDSIIAALDIASGGAGVIQDLHQKGVTVIEGKAALTLADYRDLKKELKRQKVSIQLSESSAADLREAIFLYLKKMMAKEKLKKTLDKFMKVKDQSDWVGWFKKNDKVKIELMFDYLSALPDEKLNTKLSKYVKNRIKINNLLRIIDFYKKSELCSGLKIEE